MLELGEQAGAKIRFRGGAPPGMSFVMAQTTTLFCCQVPTSRQLTKTCNFTYNKARNILVVVTVMLITGYRGSRQPRTRSSGIGQSRTALSSMEIARTIEGRRERGGDRQDVGVIYTVSIV